MNIGKANTMNLNAWETELARLDAELARAKAAGGSIRLAVRTRLLHLGNKRTKHAEQEKEEHAEQDQEEQEKKEREKEEEKKQWYARYFVLKKTLDDYIATKPADYVHPDHMSNPLQKIRRIDNAPAVQYATRPGVWGQREYRLGSFRALMRKGLHHEECALNDIHKMVRDGYTVRPERERNSSETLYIGNNLDRG